MVARSSPLLEKKIERELGGETVTVPFSTSSDLHFHGIHRETDSNLLILNDLKTD
jgi:hypothetical protein